MKWTTKAPKVIWALYDHADHLVGFAYNDEGLLALHRSEHIRRAVRYNRATTDAQEEEYIGQRALSQLELEV